MYIIGSDEVGYGAWAGPLYVCAYVVEEGWTLSGLGDSKELSPSKRMDVYERLDLMRASLIRVESTTIDQFGVGPCLIGAHVQAIKALLARGFENSRIIVDGNLRLPIARAEAMPKADRTVPAVMAASIIAKCNRDLVMRGLAREYPAYGFASHVGYGTPEHRAALDAYGPCPAHRFSYMPMKEIAAARVAS
jgi:ribonuclease HII